MDGEPVEAAASAPAPGVELVGLEVLPAESDVVDHLLRRRSRAIVTPHVAFLSDASRGRYERGPAERIVAHLRQTGVETSSTAIRRTASSYP